MVAIIGPRILAGIIAIAPRSIGLVGRVLYAAIEETGARQAEAVAPPGASAARVLPHGIVPRVLPRVMPAFCGISVFRRDINIRESMILGLVGVGGIGRKLQALPNALARGPGERHPAPDPGHGGAERRGLGPHAPRAPPTFADPAGHLSAAARRRPRVGTARGVPR